MWAACEKIVNCLDNSKWKWAQDTGLDDQSASMRTKLWANEARVGILEAVVCETRAVELNMNSLRYGVLLPQNTRISVLRESPQPL